MKFIFISIFFAISVFVWCEFCHYYLVLLGCNWPALPKHQNYINAVVLADTHLLGPIKGHWFDKLRREWQMYRSFQTATQLFKPQLTIFLGDIFDEGQWVSKPEFDDYVQRFNEIFYVDNNVERILVVGNHDIGFHYWFSRYPLLKRRFEFAFNMTSVNFIKLANDIILVNIDSMAMENDGCEFCEEARDQIKQIKDFIQKKSLSRPIVLTHFPLFRKDESECTELDSAISPERSVKFEETKDCLSKRASHYLLNQLKPRLILSGHTHNGCILKHHSKTVKSVEEWTVASFNWRNRKNPSFLLAQFSTDDYKISKCFLPNENTIYSIYSVSFLFLLCYITYSVNTLYKSSSLFRHKID